MLPYLMEDYFIACDYRLYFKKWEGEYDYIYKNHLQENQKKKSKTNDSNGTRTQFG